MFKFFRRKLLFLDSSQNVSEGHQIYSEGHQIYWESNQIFSGGHQVLVSKPQIVQPETLQTLSGYAKGVSVPTKAATSCEGADQTILKEINKCRYF